MSDTGLPTNVCLLRNEHDAHDWWYTSEGGGHMILASDVDARGFKAHHCPGKLAQATTPMSDTGAVERAARAAWEAAYLSDGEKAAHPWDAPWVREAWEAVARAALAAVAPTVEQVAKVRHEHGTWVDGGGRYLRPMCTCSATITPQEGETPGRAAQRHLDEQIAALWGAR